MPYPLGHGASWQCSPVSKSLKFGTIAQAEINLAECSRVGSIRMNQLGSARNNQEELGSIGSKQDQLGSRWKHMRKRFPGRSPTSKQLGLGSTSNWYWIPKTLFVFWLLVPIFKKIFFVWSWYRLPKTPYSFVLLVPTSKAFSVFVILVPISKNTTLLELQP